MISTNIYNIKNCILQILCFNGEAITRNPHKVNGGRSVLGSDFAVFKAFAEDVIRTLKSRCPFLVTESILRIDFFRCCQTGRIYLNEVEGILN